MVFSFSGTKVYIEVNQYIASPDLRNYWQSCRGRTKLEPQIIFAVASVCQNSATALTSLPIWRLIRRKKHLMKEPLSKHKQPKCGRERLTKSDAGIHRIGEYQHINKQLWRRQSKGGPPHSFPKHIVIPNHKFHVIIKHLRVKRVVLVQEKGKGNQDVVEQGGEAKNSNACMT